MWPQRHPGTPLCTPLRTEAIFNSFSFYNEWKRGYEHIYFFNSSFPELFFVLIIMYFQILWRLTTAQPTAQPRFYFHSIKYCLPQVRSVRHYTTLYIQASSKAFSLRMLVASELTVYAPRYTDFPLFLSFVSNSLSGIIKSSPCTV